MKCLNCDKDVLVAQNFCDWDCQLELARKKGGKVITPNNLPIKCIRMDGTMLEHEHADHPTYLFPVEVRYVGKLPEDLSEWDDSYGPEQHGLIYTDGRIAVTIYEYRYGLWSLTTGRSWMAGMNDWCLTDEALEKIRALSP